MASPVVRIWAKRNSSAEKADRVHGVDKSLLIRDAATLVLLRDPHGPEPKVLMGQRGAEAAFMPNKFVFPGGAVDLADQAVEVSGASTTPIAARLAHDAPDGIGPHLLAAAIRELWEETGLVLGTPGRWSAPPPPEWASFADTGHLPSAEGLAFIFRAITPPGRTRRFDARFFLTDAARLATDPDDFTHASDELSHLQWIPVSALRDFDLPGITKIVLGEVTARLPDLSDPDSVPFYRNGAGLDGLIRIA